MKVNDIFVRLYLNAWPNNLSGPRRVAKYCVHGGEVTSISDGQHHYVPAQKVADLYDLRRNEYILGPSGSPRTLTLGEVARHEMDAKTYGFTCLYPDSFGLYELPKTGRPRHELDACPHPDEALEPRSYGGAPADPDEWVCADCGEERQKPRPRDAYQDREVKGTGDLIDLAARHGWDVDVTLDPLTTIGGYFHATRPHARLELRTTEGSAWVDIIHALYTMENIARYDSRGDDVTWRMSRETQRSMMAANPTQSSLSYNQAFKGYLGLHLLGIPVETDDALKSGVFEIEWVRRMSAADAVWNER